MMWLVRCLILICLVNLPLSPASAHALDPGFLSLSQSEDSSWRVFWRQPDVKGSPMKIHAVLPERCSGVQPESARFDGTAWISEWTVQCSPDIHGGIVGVQGLGATGTDVLLRVEPFGETVQTVRLDGSNAQFLVPEDFSSVQVFVNYLHLGFEHILEGFDHLLFVFALLLLVQTPRRLIGAITSFTLAHSITLALASLGVLSVPAPPVEAIIALSITFLALEILKQDPQKPSITQSYPWIIAFSFGLLHGLGFAGALSEIGLPSGDIPIALLAFNVGVELGQLTFVFAVLAIFLVVRFALPKFAAACKRPHSVAMEIMGYFIGIVSVYWVMERVIGFPIFAT